MKLGASLTNGNSWTWVAEHLLRIPSVFCLACDEVKHEDSG